MLEKLARIVNGNDLELTLIINGKIYRSTFMKRFNTSIGTVQYIAKEKMSIEWKLHKDFKYLKKVLFSLFIQDCIYGIEVADTPDEEFEILKERWSMLENTNEIFKDIDNIQTNNTRLSKYKTELYYFS